MKVRYIVCSMCCGKGTVEVYHPHVREPDTETCPQCEGKRTIPVLVPDDPPRPTT